MSLFELSVDLDPHLPPVLDPKAAEPIIDRWVESTLDSFAKDGISELHFWMDVFFRHPTPYYETQVTWDRVGRDRVIHDRGIVYGGWLAGTGSRNRTTRFKGYSHWRRAVQHLDGDGGQAILDRTVPDLVDRLEGV
ncbi:MAG: hypothetical protein GY925_16860 [Actinomycetia bacterium]|nr:hypothetical protein [Actinomycetes bacterium]